MTVVDDQMKLAAQLARSGEKDQAKFIFMQIVETFPDLPQAWLWLSELSSNLEEQTEMLDQALKYLPAGADGAKDLQNALNEIHGFIPLPAPTNLVPENITPYPPLLKKTTESEIYQQAERQAIMGNHVEALRLVKEITESGAYLEQTWLLFSELSSNLTDKIYALEKASIINPNNQIAKSSLEKFRETLDKPLDAGQYLENCGEMEQALALYHMIAAKSVSIDEQTQARERISRIVSPRSSHTAKKTRSRIENIFKQLVSLTQSRL
jgi:hypothetical protein